MAKTAYHILVVDDELSMRELLEYMLNREGYQVTCADDGHKAIELLEKNQYDLLLCDIRLGDISGLDVLRATKKSNQDTVVILISAYASTETAVEAMNEGAYDYVPKPFNNDELMETIGKALELRFPQLEARANRYLPYIQRGLAVLVYAVVFLAVLKHSFQWFYGLLGLLGLAVLLMLGIRLYKKVREKQGGS